MHKKAINKIAESLKTIAAKVERPTSGSPMNFQIHDNVAYRLPNDDAIFFNEQINKILKFDDFTSKFSTKFIEKKLKTLFANLIKNVELDVERELKDMISELQDFKEYYEIYLSVDGLKTNTKVCLGRVELLPKDEPYLSEIEAKKSAIVTTLKATDKDKQYYQNMLSEEIEKEFRNGCIAKVEVVAEPDRAYEIAKEETRRVIDLIRYSSKALYPIQEDIRVGLVGEHPQSYRQGFIFSKTALHTRDDKVGSVSIFELDGNALTRMEQIGVFALSDALKKSQPTNFENTLIKTIHWFSVALTQDETGNAFLFLIISLESLFRVQSGNSIGGTVAESVAFLLSDNLEGRKKLIKLMREFYGKRSAVAHGGNKAVSDSELYTLINLVGTSIMIAIKKIEKFNSQKEFMSWIEDLKLS